MPLGDESFESAAPVSIEQLREASDESGESAGRKPELDDMLSGIPEQNRRNIDELFRGRFTVVRKLDRNRLH